MGNIFYIMGKSSSGKDTIFKELLDRKELNLKKMILYTTRPIRVGETDGVEYYFVNDKKLEELSAAGKVIELRAYNTVCGIWKYFTVYDENIDMENNNYLAIGTLESYSKLKKYYEKNYGAGRVEPILIEVRDDIRLERALTREKTQAVPNYDEMCRRFLADSKDFSEKNIVAAGILKRFYNNEDIGRCIEEIADYIGGCITTH